MTIRIIEADFVSISINAGRTWLLDTPANRAEFAAKSEIRAATTHGYGVMIDDCQEALDVYATIDGARYVYPHAEG